MLSVDLADYKDREDFEARVYPELELIAKKELEAGGGLERRVAQRMRRLSEFATDIAHPADQRADLDLRRRVDDLHRDLI